MAITLDHGARAAVERRRARRRDVALVVRIETVPTRGVTRLLTVGWTARRPHEELVERQVGDVRLYVDPRIARYTDWHDLTIAAAWHLGPFDHLAVVDEPYMLLKLDGWTRLHPAPALRPAA